MIRAKVGQSENFLHIQMLVNSLDLIGVSITLEEQLDVILEGLHEEYESTMSTDKCKVVDMYIGD